MSGGDFRVLGNLLERQSTSFASLTEEVAERSPVVWSCSLYLVGYARELAQARGNGVHRLTSVKRPKKGGVYRFSGRPRRPAGAKSWPRQRCISRPVDASIEAN